MTYSKHFQSSVSYSNSEKRQSLLVDDFAHRRTSYITPKVKSKRSVQFSTVQDVRLYERSNDVYVIEMFYSEAEINEMRMAKRREIKDVHKRFILLKSSGYISESECFEGCVFTGIESFLTPELIQQSKRCKRACWHAVLKEQAMQRAAGEYNPHELAKASQIRSMWAVKRAEKIAYHQSRYI